MSKLRKALREAKPLLSTKKKPRRRAVVAGRESPNDEPKIVREARERLRPLVAHATKGADRSSIGLVLAIVSQETGNQAAANALIDEYDLGALGLKKF